MVTIRDVAKHAGVSPSTVSRVMNNTGTISAETTKKVMAAAGKLGYEPNLLARSFRMQQTRIILVIVPNITNPYYAHILGGISETSRKLGYSSFICDTGGDKKQERELLDMLQRRRADGAILMASELGDEWLLPYSEKHPMVQCSEYIPHVPIAHVAIDNYEATRDAMRYLTDLGHRRIGTLSSVNQYISTRLRMQGYKDGLAAASTPVNDDYIYYGAVDYSFESGREGAKKLLQLPTPPTALFCISDVLAQGAIEGARDLGLSVPDDVTVVGFDDVEQTMRYRPYVTTVAQPCHDIGVKATEVLYDLMNRKPQKNGPAYPMEDYHHVVPHQLIVRESSAPPKKD